jgi:acyl carrier protein
MEKESVLGKLRGDVIRTEMGVPASVESVVGDDLTLLEGGMGFDSIKTFEFISFVERAFGIQFDEADLPEDGGRFTLSYVADLILRKNHGG